MAPNDGTSKDEVPKWLTDKLENELVVNNLRSYIRVLESVTEKAAHAGTLISEVGRVTDGIRQKMMEDIIENALEAHAKMVNKTVRIVKRKVPSKRSTVIGRTEVPIVQKVAVCTPRKSCKVPSMIVPSARIVGNMRENQSTTAPGKSQKFVLLGHLCFGHFSEKKELVARALTAIGIATIGHEVDLAQFGPFSNGFEALTALIFEVDDRKTAIILNLISDGNCCLKKYTTDFRLKDLVIMKAISRWRVLKMETTRLCTEFLTEKYSPIDGYVVTHCEEAAVVKKCGKLVEKITVEDLIANYQDVFEKTISLLDLDAKNEMKDYAVDFLKRWNTSRKASAADNASGKTRTDQESIKPGRQRFSLVGFPATTFTKKQKLVAKALTSIGVSTEPSEVAPAVGQVCFHDYFSGEMFFSFTFAVGDGKTSSILNLLSDNDVCCVGQYTDDSAMKAVKIMKEISDWDILKMETVRFSVVFLNKTYSPINGYAFEMCNNSVDVKKSGNTVEKITVEDLIVKYPDAFEKTIRELLDKEGKIEMEKYAAEILKAHK
ncbi:unnamed protein product [Caenorhabditis sp. 36 PRJEB53466]|nr:unnamed protein product [Caenorhabditis sp. 36 PRJEB53466]